MRPTRQRKRSAVIAAVLLSSTIAVTASAATRPTSGFYLQTKGKLRETVASFSLKGTKLYDFSHFDTCVTSVIQTPVVTQLHGSTFAFHKVVTGGAKGNGKFDLSISGHFTSATTATGTATYKKVKGDVLGPAGCHSTVKFTVKRDGPPRPPNKGS